MSRLVLLLAASLLLACSSQTSTPSAEPANPGKTPKSSDAEVPAEEGHADPNAGPPGAPPEDCPFMVKETCYKEQDAACKAAGCAPDKCMVLESYPAQIQCG